MPTHCVIHQPEAGPAVAQAAPTAAGSLSTAQGPGCPMPTDLVCQTSAQARMSAEGAVWRMMGPGQGQIGGLPEVNLGGSFIYDILCPWPWTNRPLLDLPGLHKQNSWHGFE